MKKIFECIKNNVPYLIFVIAVGVCLLIYAIDSNPGNVYVGEGTRTDIFNTTDYSELSEAGFSYLNNGYCFAGVSIWFDLSEKLSASNFTRTTVEKSGIKKDIEEPANGIGADGNITITAYVDEKVIGKWEISPSEIRPGTATQFVLSEPIEGMNGNTIRVAVDMNVSPENIHDDIVTDGASVSGDDASSKISGVDASSRNSYVAAFPVAYEPIYSKLHASKIHLIYYALTVILFGLSIWASYHWNYQISFAVFAGVMALLWMIALPFGRVPDETDHFFRAYEISEGRLTTDILDETKVSYRDGGKGSFSTMSSGDGLGHVDEMSYDDGVHDSFFIINNGDINSDGSAVMNVSRGAFMPAGLDANIPLHTTTFRDVINNRGVELDKNNENWYVFPNMALYSPVSYIPQLLGLVVTRLFTNKVLVMAYVGRLMMALFTVIMLTLAIKIMPVKKESVFILGMLPMMFQEGISWSADAFINVVAIFYICYVLYLAFGKNAIRSASTVTSEKNAIRSASTATDGNAVVTGGTWCDTNDRISTLNLILLWVLSLTIALCKVVYVPLILLMVIISKDRYGGRMKKIINCCGTFIAGCALNLAWMSLTNLTESASGEQIQYILTYPFEFIKIIPRTLLTFTTEIFGEFLGNNLGGLNIPVYSLPLVLMGIYWLYVTMVPTDDDGPSFSTGVKWVFALVWILVIALTFGSMYLGFNSVGNNLIVGFQGRYLIPVALAILFSIEAKRTTRQNTDTKKYAYPMMVAINLFAIFTVLNHTMW